MINASNKNKFIINKGDYIDSHQFTREECERFCELAGECGFPMSEFPFDKEYGIYRFIGIGQISLTGGVVWFESSYYYKGERYYNNITTKFREFLDKEKGVKKFTKDDLKDGMRIEIDTNPSIFYVCGETFVSAYPHNNSCGEIKNLDENLQSKLTGARIMRVTDRDGTVLFEREEEPRDLTIEEIAKAFNLPVERVRIKR